ncbi:type VI secretion system Vgr family protein [Reyranella sp.]|uniref:type VI secretion system Vgr family protein n=1 Tax=Reyranella sp. TaxID=1929291 RepID=UPI00120E6245|nr:type VI secretion system tip protein TssI/VgrG [Reyranella sp.]TAJ83504.1 MAG: type VI secretion system tip protein VgrG [Reyranella sp.]
MPDDTKPLLSLTSTAESPLQPIRMVAHEIICDLFHFEIEAIAEDKIDARGMLNKPACLAVNHGDEATRYFHGIVSRFGVIEQKGHTDTLYHMVLVPQLAHADIRSDCRLFFNKTAEDIIKTILDETGVTKTAFRLYSQPPQRKVTTQYNETALDFVTRLMEEEGWYYFFEHASDGHTLVITNDNNGFTTIPEAVVRLGMGDMADTLTEHRKIEEFAEGKIALRDYDDESPSKNLKVEQSTILKHGGTAHRPVFHWPALTYDTSQAKERAKRRMEAAEAAVSLIGANGAMANLFAGGKYKFRDKDGTETVQVVREITHTAEDTSAQANNGTASYSNNFSAFPNTVPWREPMETPRPRMEGLHTAIVVGPAGEEIYTDDYGRIKIRFPWDWRSDATADSGNWARVVQPWAGDQWGAQFIPRVGTEVAVAFMDSDPDRPIVVGGLYNGNDKPIFPVGEKTKLGFRSRSTTGGGSDEFNEISVDDKKGNEVVFLHAQKDMTVEVEHDHKLTVENDRKVVITGNEDVTLKRGNQTTKLDQGNVSVTTTLGKITLEALDSITLKVGSSSIKLDQMGVTVKGMMVKVEGTVMTEVKGTMTTVTGTAMLTLKGGILMIN